MGRMGFAEPKNKKPSTWLGFFVAQTRWRRAATQRAGKGSVDAGGKFQSDPFTYPSAIAGIVGGSGASEAMYIYQRSFGTQFLATGGTTWHK